MEAFVRLRLCVRFAGRESPEQALPSWKLMYAFDHRRFPTVHEVAEHLRRSLDIASHDLSILIDGYEVPLWCSSRVFQDNDLVDIWILPGQLSMGARPSRGAAKSEARKRQRPAEPKPPDALKQKCKRFLERQANALPKTVDPNNPGHVYFLSSEAEEEAPGRDVAVNCRNVSKSGSTVLRLDRTHVAKDLGKFATPYDTSTRKQTIKRGRRRQKTATNSNVSFVFEKLGQVDVDSLNTTTCQTPKDACTISVQENEVTMVPLDDPLQLKTSKTIHFKVLELNDDMEAIMSDWKQAKVVCYNPVTKEITLRGFVQKAPDAFTVEHSDLDEDEMISTIPWNLLYDPHIEEKD